VLISQFTFEVSFRFGNLHSSLLKFLSVHFSSFPNTSLDNLRKYGIRSIKIDQSFISELRENRVNRALVKSGIAMAKAVGVSTVAEGVESTEMLEILRGMGIDYFQGYAIARPMPFDDLCVWLQQRNTLRKN
jgi:EAL domain-containing protein (putative c-di-GMP-specific phosphodiesterase class I)